MRIFQSGIWVMGGLGADGVVYADAWVAPSGNNWRKMDVPWSPRSALFSFAFTVRGLLLSGAVVSIMPWLVPPMCARFPCGLSERVRRSSSCLAPAVWVCCF